MMMFRPVSMLSSLRFPLCRAFATATPSTTTTFSSVSSSASSSEHGIALTERAVAQIKHLRLRENNPLLKLRVAVDGGGCSGFQYSFALADRPAADDTVVSADDAELLVDAVSLPLLRGAVVDYERELVKAAFRVAHNPNAEASCGCGTSFVAKESALPQS